jgi:hypothetical protein
MTTHKKPKSDTRADDSAIWQKSDLFYQGIEGGRPSYIKERREGGKGRRGYCF